MSECVTHRMSSCAAHRTGPCHSIHRLFRHYCSALNNVSLAYFRFLGEKLAVFALVEPTLGSFDIAVLVVCVAH